MRRYETVMIVHADLPDDETASVINRYTSIITGLKGIVVRVDTWGKRKLAYEINKQTRGYYVLLDYAGQSTIVTELERNFKIDDNILKYMTIMKDGPVNRQDLEQEIASANVKGKQIETPAPAPVMDQEPAKLQDQVKGEEQ